MAEFFVSSAIRAFRAKLIIAMQATNAIDEPVFTAEELAKSRKLHPATIRKLFVDEPGVIRLGHGGRRGKRQYFTLRIPHSVAERVFRRLSVGGGSVAA